MTGEEPPPVAAGKPEWRKWAKSVRKGGVSPETSLAVTACIGAWLPLAPPGVVVLYLPLPDEIDLTSILERRDREFALTRAPPDGPLSLHEADGPRERHRYGFEQPRTDTPLVDPSGVGVVLVPGLVFDRTGQRLGRGAAYYDTFLPTVPSEAARVAIVPESLVVMSVPVEPHDVRMTHIATEFGVVEVSAN